MNVAVTPGVTGGKPRIAGRHITVRDVGIWHERMGRGAHEIAAEHDLAPAYVYAALAYYTSIIASRSTSLAVGGGVRGIFARAYPSRLKEKLATREPLG